jgi:hypothetical protein
MVEALDKIELAARIYARDNPHVWALFVRFTFELIRSGRQSYSSKAVFERIRWHVDVTTKSVDEFKINNNYTAIFARWFHAQYPQHVGFFRTRERIAKKAS